MSEPMKQSGIAYIRAKCPKCERWAAMEMPEDHVWQRQIDRLRNNLEEAMELLTSTRESSGEGWTGWLDGRLYALKAKVALGER